MAKLLGTNQQGLPVQAAAGWQDEVLSPVGLLFTAGALVGGWQIGSVLGEVWREGEIWPDKPEKDPTDAEELVGFGAAVAGSIVTWQATEEMFKKYGWEKMALYGSGLLAFVVVGRAIRDRM